MSSPGETSDEEQGQYISDEPSLEQGPEGGEDRDAAAAEDEIQGMLRLADRFRPALANTEVTGEAEARARLRALIQADQAARGSGARWKPWQWRLARADRSLWRALLVAISLILAVTAVWAAVLATRR